MIKIITVINQYWPFEGGAESLAKYIVEQTNTSSIQNNVLAIANTNIDSIQNRRLPALESVDNLYDIRRIRILKIFGREKNGKIFKYLTFLRFILKLVSMKNQIDFIHAHTFYLTTAASIIAGKLINRPVIVTGHSTLTMLIDEIDNKKQPKFLLKILKYSDIYIAINEFIKNEAISLAKIPENKIVTINNGIDTDIYQPIHNPSAKAELRQTLNLPPNTPIIIYHGRFEDYKNIQGLLEALSALLQDNETQFLLVLIGNGPYKDHLVKLAGELGLIDRVQFRGFQKNASEYLQAADIYCLPSHIEGLSLALLEALSCGLLCIASDIAANKSVIKNGTNGYLFPARSPIGLKDILFDSITNLSSSKADNIRKNARDTVVSQFSLQKMAAQYIDLFKSMKKKPE